jgi:serine/threonine protein kinase/formylglycine-generating enzyme required for sulfatase activity
MDARGTDTAVLETTQSRRDSNDGAGRLPAEPPDVIDRYQLRRLLGEGGMSRVYLARDTALGRSVALKLLRPDRVTVAEAEDVLREARITARLNHPHIVQLYDARVHEGRAFLALEYLEGESLQQRMARDRPSIDESLRIAHAIADALAHAHDAGIHHCDLKPSNVMLPRDGRVRVVDFGLASMVGAELRHGGTPDWMAPEQWRREPTTGRVDSWTLAALVYSLVAGVHPFGGAASADARRALVLDPSVVAPVTALVELPETVRTLVVRSLDRNAAARPTAREWAHALAEATSNIAASPTTESPFRGLSAFEEVDAQFFFGRDAEIDSFLERLRHEPCLPIVGPSGAGKSSFLHAGVIPRLRARQRWCVVAMRPGSDPFHAVAHQLVRASLDEATPPPHDEVVALTHDLRATPSLLAARLATISNTRKASVLFACDQLEELFTQAASIADSARFLEALCCAADDPAEPVRVTFTLRDDFLGQMPELQQLFVLRRLGRADLMRTIIGPIERLGYAFDDPSVVDHMLADVSGSPFDLPLLQFACRTMWESRDASRRQLLKQAYVDQGGVAHALAKHADGVLREMSSAQQRITRGLFSRLVTGTKARRTVELEALVADLDGDARTVIDRLVSARLLVKRREPGEDHTFVEIAHESLLETWAQLRTWLDETHEERRAVQELEEAAEYWLRRGQRPEQTPNAVELAAAEERIHRLGIVPSPRISAYLAAGERWQHSLRRRRLIWRTVIAVIAGAVTLISLILARTFREQKIAAEDQASALRLAHGNSGELDIAIELFGGSPGDPVPLAANLYPDLSIRLFAPDNAEIQRPGLPLAANLVHVARLGSAVFRVDAPGGTVFLQIDGRGRAGQRCAASWLRIQSFPGYAERTSVPHRIKLAVPSCDASASDSVEIPGGEVIYGGTGEPATKYVEYVEPERVIDVPAFAIDRTEISNAAFRPFAQLASTTGYPVPTYPSDGALGGQAAQPVTAIDAFEAEAFCRYMGKRLPSDAEWTKAARGGVRLATGPNPFPRRLYPWGPTWRRECVNLDGEADGFAWVAPVDAMPCGRSPYGVYNLVGNVAEWISRDGQTAQDTPLREVRGGTAESPAELEQVTTVFRNGREARHFDFATGVRCATDGDVQRGSRWQAH